MIIKNRRLNERFFRDRVEKSLEFVMEKVRHNQPFRSEDLRNGKMILAAYSPKDKESPYDRNPLILIVKRTSKHILGLNLHWCPPQLRTALLQLLFKANRQNIKRNRPLVIDSRLSRVFWRIARPIWRKYIIRRLSRRGAVFQPDEFANIVLLKSERFIGISSTQAYTLSVQKLRQR